jgi:hypothetical protein
VLRAKWRVSFAASDGIIAASDSMNKTSVPPAPSENDKHPFADKEGGARKLGKPSEGFVSEPSLEVPLSKTHSDFIAPLEEELGGASEGPLAEGRAPKDACLQVDPMEQDEVPLSEAHSDSIAPPAEETGGASEGPLAEGVAPEDACLQDDPMQQDEVPLSKARLEPRVPPAKEAGEAFDVPLTEGPASEDNRTPEDLRERDADPLSEAHSQPMAPVAMEETRGGSEVPFTEARASEKASPQVERNVERFKVQLSEANSESMAPPAKTSGADSEEPLTQAGAPENAWRPDNPMERVEVSLPEAPPASMAPLAETWGAGSEVPLRQAGAPEDARTQGNLMGRDGASIWASTYGSAEVGAQSIPDTTRILQGTIQQHRQQNWGPQSAMTKSGNLFRMLQRRHRLNASEKQATTEQQRSDTRKLLSLPRKPPMSMDDAEKPGFEDC